MNRYTANDVFVLAKRHHNTKRTYLLINPLQAKHLPVSPSKSLEMMTCLGNKIAEKYPSANLVIGFAETATAIAATVADCIGKNCNYIHTTRESYSNISDWILFNEEHSHAVEQKLYSKNLIDLVSNTSQIVFVDDEISTGKTLLNFIEQLRTILPDIRTKEIIAASIINRLSPEHEKRFIDAGIMSECLVKLNNEDLTNAVESYNITSPELIKTMTDKVGDNVFFTKEPLMNPRFGVDITKYTNSCNQIGEHIQQFLVNEIHTGSNILILGTEECMYPALILGKRLEKDPSISSVRCHATTRSPIGICNEPSYPIHSGYKIHSFYEDERNTYIYNLSYYDMAIVYTDSNENDLKARADLTKILRENGCPKVLFVEGGNHV